MLLLSYWACDNVRRKDLVPQTECTRTRPVHGSTDCALRSAYLVDSYATDESPVCACVCAVNAVRGVSDLDDGTWIGRTLD